MLWEFQICSRNGVCGFSDFDEALAAAKDIWFNKVDVNGWLEAFATHPQIGVTPSETHKSPASAQWSNGEQSTALSTANDSTACIWKLNFKTDLHYWNASYKEKFGFVFLISASGRSAPEILTEIKKRYNNRLIVEFENAAHEQMKIIELRLSKLFSIHATDGVTMKTSQTTGVTKAGGFVLDTLRALFCFSCFIIMFLTLLFLGGDEYEDY